jgi:hypothetical protein
MDLFGQVVRSRTEKQENAAALRALPCAPNAKRDPTKHRLPDTVALVNETVKALYVAPVGETADERKARVKAIYREKSQFRSRAKSDARMLHKRKARALGLLTGWNEMVNSKFVEGA